MRCEENHLVESDQVIIRLRWISQKEMKLFKIDTSGDIELEI